MQEPILFNPRVAAQKPRSVLHDPCPFCAREYLTDILAQKDEMIWLVNKYPVMEKTWQTVLIETAKHDSDIATYAPEEWENILRFSMEKWRETIARRRFRSVIYYRNFGPTSGGSIRHPHSQIIGCESFDYMQNVRLDQLDGEVLHETNGVRVTLSDHPICGLREFNVRLKDPERLDEFADSIQKLVKVIVDPNGWGYASYNLFFYAADYEYCKIIARGVTSPLFLGYMLTQAPDAKARQAIREELMPLWTATRRR